MSSKYKPLSQQKYNYSEDIASFGKKLRQYREKNGLSLDNLASSTGSDKAALSKLENGERIPKYDTVLKMADALFITPAQLSPERYSDEALSAVLPQIYERLIMLPTGKRDEAVAYITALLDGLLLRERGNNE